MGKQSVRDISKMHAISKCQFDLLTGMECLLTGSTRCHITSIRNGMEAEPLSAEARALKSDQQLHYRRAFEQRELEKKRATEDMRLATRVRIAEEKTHYHQRGKSVGATWPVFRAAVGYAVDLR